MELSFDKPYQILEFLTSDNASYKELTDTANSLLEKIPDAHINQDGRHFQAITQCILECYKRIYNFHSNKWISQNRLENDLFAKQVPITFTRINGKNEICEYSIINFDQIDFSKQKEFADEYKILKTTQKNSPKQELANNEDSEFNKVLTLLKNGENVFLTGYAGTGKSYILNKLKEKLKKKLTITSTTGIAAVNVRGQTLHSWAGVGLCKNPVYKTIEKIRTRPAVIKQILNCKILAVDEISMLNIETFEYIDEVLRSIRDSSEPFGGIQVLFIGDFYQLPPVEILNMNNELFNVTDNRRYCFESHLWNELNLKNVILKKNYRQSETKFIKALSDMRINCLDSEDINLLKTRETNIDTFETNMLHIFATNNEADKYNIAKFNMIDEPVRVYSAIDGVYRGSKPVYNNFTESENYILEIFGRNCRADKNIELKIGARVMLLINMDFNKGLINGSCGTIQAFNENSININFDNGESADIPRHTFEYYYHDKLTAERTQFPLKLAYGITIHKSQGMTLDKLVVDCSKIFERGQAYVAMSRVKTLDGLYLKSFNHNKVMVDEKVAKFYSEIEEVKNVIPCSQLEFNLDEVDTEEKIDDEEAKRIIINCVKYFNGNYGKSGISKILHGSKTIENNSFHSKAYSSEYFGMLKSKKRKEIDRLIDELIQNKTFDIKRITFGRPILCINT